jgi:hypothetical protein
MTYARNTLNAVCSAPPEDEQVMLETCRGPRFSINLMKSASCWFNNTELFRSVTHTGELSSLPEASYFARK